MSRGEYGISEFTHLVIGYTLKDSLVRTEYPGTVLRQLFDLSAAKVQKLFNFWVLLCKQFVHQELGSISRKYRPQVYLCVSLKIDSCPINFA